MKEKSIAERFPYLFKLESGDEAWYESMGVIEEPELDSVSDELVSAAGEHVARTLVSSTDEDTFSNYSYDFMYGATWYFTNSHILQKLPIEQFENAIIIAQTKYAKQDCENVFPDEDWTLSEAYDFIYTSKSFFLDGVEWAENANRE